MLDTPPLSPRPDQTLPTDPVAHHDRLLALDAARGVALLGIFVVNIAFFAAPLAEAFAARPPADQGVANVAAWWVNKLFFEGRFYPLFSTLFGMGLVLQMGRARAAGRNFGWLYVRRLAALVCFGVAHAVLLWYGDVLIFYSAAGLVLLACARLSPRWLLTIAAAAMLLGLTLSVGMQLLTAPQKPAVTTPATEAAAPAEPPPADSPLPPKPSDVANKMGEFGKTPVGRLFIAMESGNFSGPQHPAWVEAEVESYQRGPFVQALLIRAVTWFGMAVFMVVGMFWHVIAMFCVGAALMKLRFFDPDRRAWRVRLVGVGLAVGLPMVLASILSHMRWEHEAVGKAVAGPLLMLGGTAMALAYLSGVALLVESGRAAGLWRMIASTGRAALSVYLAESLIATAVMYHWGWGRFNTFSLVERLGFVLVVYAALVLAANLWLRAFRMGPMEWVWRTLTYLKPQPLLR